MNRLTVYILVLVFCISFWTLTIGAVWHFTSVDVPACIVGEAEDQGYEGMVAVAHAIRNRGNISGVDGCKAERVVKKLYSQHVYEQAVKAWKSSRRSKDSTNGADHWVTKDRWNYSGWLNKCQLTYVYKDHVFCKEIKNGNR